MIELKGFTLTLVLLSATLPWLAAGQTQIGSGSTLDAEMNANASEPSQVRIGMRIEQVVRSLGEPARKEAIPPDAQLWHYPDGEIAFDDGVVSYVALQTKIPSVNGNIRGPMLQSQRSITGTHRSGRAMFDEACASCHGAGGRGKPGIPVLRDDDWLFGGSLAKLKESIMNGRAGAMTAHEAILTPKEVDTLARFAVDLSEARQGSDDAWKLYKEKGCGACHGSKADGILAELPNGENVTVGAANLTDSIWRFEPGGYDSARYTILYGVNQPGVYGTRRAVCPGVASATRLEKAAISEEDVENLALYVYELRGVAAPERTLVEEDSRWGSW